MIAILVLLFFSFSHSVETIPLTQAQKTWQGLQKCSEQKGSLFLECSKKHINPQLNLPTKQLLLMPIDQGLKFTDLRECQTEDVVQPLKLTPKDSAYCMRILGLEKTSQGYVLFSSQNGSIFITEIRYKF